MGFRIVGIGASAGGLEAIIALLRQLPADLPAALMVVLHRAPGEPSYLQAILERESPLPVKLAQQGMAVLPGFCFVSSPNFHMTLAPGRKLHLVQDGFYRGNNIDLLFQSLAHWAGRDAIGVVLSGLLKDGSVGLAAIKGKQGAALVQTPLEAAYPDMPQNAIQSDGPIDFIGTTNELAREICRRCEAPAPNPSLMPAS